MRTFFKRFRTTRQPDLVQSKMNFPQRCVSPAAIANRKVEIRRRLFEHYGIEVNGDGHRVNKPKPRVRYKLRLQRWPMIRTLPFTKRKMKIEEMVWVYRTLFFVLFFLSSAPVEAQYASVSGSWDNFHIVDGRWLSPNRAAWDRPVVYKTYSQFETRSTPIKWLFRPRIDTATFGCNAYTRQQRQAEYDALVNGPRATPFDWRKFWTWFAAIGTGALALLFALLYGAWRSVK